MSHNALLLIDYQSGFFPDPQRSNDVAMCRLNALLEDTLPQLRANNTEIIAVLTGNRDAEAADSFVLPHLRSDEHVFYKTPDPVSGVNPSLLGAKDLSGQDCLTYIRSRDFQNVGIAGATLAGCVAGAANSLAFINYTPEIVLELTDYEMLNSRQLAQALREGGALDDHRVTTIPAFLAKTGEPWKIPHRVFEF